LAMFSRQTAKEPLLPQLHSGKESEIGKFAKFYP
jgi:hypothetical protein